MRNYELLRLIHEELVQGNGKRSFSNPYLNTVIKLTNLIEEERPEMKEIIDDKYELGRERLPTGLVESRTAQ
tara:strand:+ start:314 stop:529 length:216 start_codon:yes stop_codon:yes gene_type:complete